MAKTKNLPDEMFIEYVEEVPKEDSFFLAQKSKEDFDFSNGDEKTIGIYELKKIIKIKQVVTIVES